MQSNKLNSFILKTNWFTCSVCLLFLTFSIRQTIIYQSFNNPSSSVVSTFNGFLCQLCFRLFIQLCFGMKLFSISVRFAFNFLVSRLALHSKSVSISFCSIFIDCCIFNCCFSLSVSFNQLLVSISIQFVLIVADWSVTTPSRIKFRFQSRSINYFLFNFCSIFYWFLKIEV